MRKELICGKRVSAGGIATPADAALMMQLGAETVFVGSGIFMKERATPLLNVGGR